MQLYLFERIYSQMEKEFGKIKKGNEEAFSMLLYSGSVLLAEGMDKKGKMA